MYTEDQIHNKKNEYSNSDIYERSNGGTILNDRLCGVLAVTRAFGDFSLKKAGLTAVPEIKKI
jgi:serine/threonine protein phosphatase PrpC